MADDPKHKLTVYLLRFAIIIGVITVLFLLCIPADPRHAVFFIYSKSRLALIGLVCFCTAFFTTSLFFTPWFKKTSELLFTDEAVDIALIGLILALGGCLVLAGGSFVWMPLQINEYVADRILPIGIYALLLFVGITTVQRHTLRHYPFEHLGNSIQGVLKTTYLKAEVLARNMDELGAGSTVVIAVLVLAPVLLYLPFKYAEPIGSAGLYALMGDLIVQTHFSLPFQVPYYGPGGLPFAYPPSGFYLMAFIEKIISIDSLQYVRFAPAIFYLMSLVPFIYIAFEFCRSWAGALVSAVILATSRTVMLVHETAGGSIRGLAFLFALTSIYLYLKARRGENWKLAILSGLFAGVTALTHFSYAVFLLLFFVAWLVWRITNMDSWKYFILMALTGLLIFVPWLFITYNRYGFDVLQGALQSHGNDYFLKMLENYRLVLPWFENTLRPVSREALLWNLTITATIITILERKGYLVVWLALILFFSSESSRFVVAIGALMIGILISRLYRSFVVDTRVENDRFAGHLRGMALVFIVASLFLWRGWLAVTTTFPPIHISKMTELAGHVQQKMPADARYLSLTGDADAEWFPYLFHRSPMVGTWGAEWLGKYPENLDYLSSINGCLESTSPTCVEGVLSRLKNQPSYVISPANSMLINQYLTSSQIWQETYRNEDFIFWQNGY